MTKGLVAITMVLGLTIGSLACHREKGVMEKAGEKVDNVIEDVTHPNEGPIEKAGRKIDENVQDAKDKLDK